MSGRLYVLFNLSVITGAVALMLTASALASNWLTNGGKKAGDSNVYFDRCALSQNTSDAFISNDTHNIESTDITTTLFTSCDTQDVRINDYAYGTDDPTGWYECHELHSANNCDKGHAHINTSYSNIPEDYLRTLTLVCEEIGHSVGLGHRFGTNDSCMSNDLSDRHLDNHNQGHLDDNY